MGNGAFIPVSDGDWTVFQSVFHRVLTYAGTRASDGPCRGRESAADLDPGSCSVEDASKVSEKTCRPPKRVHKNRLTTFRTKLSVHRRGRQRKLRRTLATFRTKLSVHRRGHQRKLCTRSSLSCSCQQCVAPLGLLF